ncbi:MAG TPA: hypothetical protein VFV50_06035 [Bdellovibrionales bacterium]|nr:hypothetical protein [Bdellovibrionales bacterium]
MSRELPSFVALADLCARFKREGLIVALGGSGLLHALGLTDSVGDWDLTTDAPWSRVERALAGLNFEKREPTAEFASEFWCKIEASGASIDLMGSFAIRDGSRVHRVKTIVTGEWRGIPLGSPREWLAVYELLGRDGKAGTLAAYLKQKPVHALH